ncbi:MAG TPA: 4-phosphopantoate--beta-alanine ligase [Nitrososphaeraceae archaeon]|nr:4-phosphopantoate--beta-alanine ligase [Nitrososphaeraceae archaeon]
MNELNKNNNNNNNNFNNIPSNHPRAKSLAIRELLVNGSKSGMVAVEGLIAHGRGEAFDYLLGEKTSTFALNAIKAAASLLLLAKKPIISVNGNTAALCPRDIVDLANETGAMLEVNLFYRTKEREYLIEETLKKNGANIVLGVGQKKFVKIPELTSNRRHVDPEGIFLADVVFVPLEDGDRTKALINMNKKVITIDLNPLSRTSQTATISIIDNIVRAVPELVKSSKQLKHMDNKSLFTIFNNFDNQYNLDNSLRIIRGRV